MLTITQAEADAGSFASAPPAAAWTVPLVLIDDDPGNVRRVAADGDADAGLRASMSMLGLLQPVGLRPADALTGRHQVVFGHRRVRAARALGWTDIMAVLVAERAGDASLSQAAENMVRAPMHPVDQWRAVQRMVAQGCAPETAAMALGMGEAHLRRMSVLGRILPAMLDAMAALPARDMPKLSTLATIANAPLDVQAAVWAERSNANEPLWWQIEQACRRTRIPLKRAIFDAATAQATVGLTFEEDLFAEPGSDEQFTTTDTEKFLHCQTAALREDVQRLAASKRPLLGTMKDGQLQPPAGWELAYTNIDITKPLKKGDPGKIVTAVVDSGWNMGAIVRRYALPMAEKSAKAKPAAQATDAPDAGEGEPTNAYTKKALDLIAARKDAMLRAGLEHQPGTRPSTLLAALCLTLAARNVSIRGAPHPNGHSGRFDDLLPAFFNADGRVMVPDNVTDIACQMIARVLVCPGPGVFTSSGPMADWVGALLDIDPPRLDDAEMLGVLKGEELTRAAREADIAVPVQVSAMRKALEGKLPDWRPAPALFDAPPFKPRASAAAWDEEGDVPEADNEGDE